MTDPLRSERLFSYGTLQQAAVQLANFGRELSGAPDELVGYVQTWLQITDPEVIRISGSDRHPVVTSSPDPADGVPGTVFELTEEEVLAADAYEVDDYARVEVTLRSGLRAWVYLAADPVPRPQDAD